MKVPEIEGIGELDLNDWGSEEADGLETVDDEMQVMEFDQEEIQRMDEKAEEEMPRGCGGLSHIADGNLPDAATPGSTPPTVLRRAGHRRQGRVSDGDPARGREGIGDLQGKDVQVGPMSARTADSSQQMVHPLSGFQTRVWHGG